MDETGSDWVLRFKKKCTHYFIGVSAESKTVKSGVCQIPDQSINRSTNQRNRGG